MILSSSALAEEWQILTDPRYVRDIVELEGKLVLATEGGLVEYSPEANHFRVFTTLDGLGGIGVNRLETDPGGGVWLAFDNRMLQRWDSEIGVTHSVQTISQQEGVQSLNKLEFSPRGLFVATNRGIALITYASRFDQWVWFEEYRKLGGFDSDIPVRSILIEGDSIWATTSQGLALGDLTSDPPLDWVNFSAAQGFPGSEAREIVRVNGILYVTTDRGLIWLDGNRWRLLDSRGDVYKLYEQNDTLFAVTSDGLSRWMGDRWERFGDRRLGITSAAVDDQGGYWAGFAVNGLGGGGIAALDDSVWVDLMPSGPISNNLLAAAFSEDGYSYFVGGKSAGEYGLSRVNQGEWQRWAAPEFVGTTFHYPHRSIALDRHGGAWVGTFGGGVARYALDGTFAIYNADSASGGRLKGYDSRPNNPLTSSIAADQAGNIWVVNRSARDGNILACIPDDFINDPDPDRDWYYFHRSNFRSFSEFDLLTIDGRGRKWIASTANNPSIAADQGVYILDDRGTLADSTDDLIFGPLPGLPTAEVLSLKYDPAGYIWVGSPRGAYYVQATDPDLSRAVLTQVYAMRDIPIYTIAIDASGNKWFGTEFGVSILSPDLFSIVKRYSTDPPDNLPALRVNLVAIDPYSGFAYLGTRQGTAVLRTPYRDYGDEITSLTFEPNPFNPENSRLIFTGTSLAGNGGLRIYTPDGRIIRKLTHDEAALGWDGRDDNGKGVAEGVYLILSYNGAGQAGQGKVAVIRR